MSDPRGSAQGWNGQRFSHYMALEHVLANLAEDGFKVLDHFTIGQTEGLECSSLGWRW